MKTHTRLSFFLAALLLASCSQEKDKAMQVADLPLSSVSSFVQALDEQLPGEIHSFILKQHGEEVASAWWAPYREEDTHMLFSLSKSFTSTAIGMAQDEGLLSIDDQVISFFPESLPDQVSENLAAMRIRDLLKMNTGHQDDALWRMQSDSSWVRGFLALEVEHKPGTHFRYNSGASYMMSAIIQKVSGMSLDAFLTPRLFEPLGIENHYWESSPEGINMGGWGLNLTTGSISKFGQFLLQEGEWEGRQLVSKEWIREATSFQTSNGSNPESDWEQGYGYQFWMCKHGMFRGDGAFGQYCIVFPEYDAVLAMTSGTGDMQAVLNLVWEHILPGLQGQSDQGESKQGSSVRAGLSRDELDSALAALSIPTPASSSQQEDQQAYSEVSYFIDDNPLGVRELRFNFSQWPVEVEMQFQDERYSFSVGQDEWISGKWKTPMYISDEIASSGSWEGPHDFLMKNVFIETPFIATHHFSFDESSVEWKIEVNASFGGQEMPTMLGHLAD